MTDQFRDDESPDEAPGGEVVPLRPEHDAVAAVPEPAGGPALRGEVVPAEPGELGLPAGERRPVIPDRYRRENIRATVEASAATQAHKARYHGLRAPLYLAAAATWAVVGAARVAGAVLRWWWLAEQGPLRSDAVIAGDAAAWSRLHKHAREVRRTRGIVLLAGAAVLAGGCAVLAVAAPWWGQALAVLAAAAVLARAGQPEGHRIVAPAVVPAAYQEPTVDVITTALASLGITGIDRAVKDGRGLAFITPVMRDGPGWGVLVDLPHGVTAEHVIARRRELASGLRRPLSATWPEPVPAEHEGRLSLWVGFTDISKQKTPKHPLLRAGTCDFFGAVPFGTDPRMRPVTVSVFELNFLFGAAPGQGKTNGIRGLGAALSLDPLVDLQVHEHAGKGDLEPLAQVCSRYVSGLDDDAIAYTAESLRLLRADLERRSVLFRGLPRADRPEGKVTRELAERYPALRPRVVIIDECQNVFAHPAHGKQAQDDASYVARVARAYGLVLILGTQRPESGLVPTSVTGVMTARFCLHVPDQVSNDLVLGTGSYKAGYNCSQFRPKTDAGIGWLRAESAPQIVRTYRLDLDPAARIAARGRALRERAGTLTGYAVGLDESEVVPRDVLADILSVWPEGRAGLQWAELADLLAARYPDRWAEATDDSVGAQVRAMGVASVDVRVPGDPAAGRAKGCRRQGIEQAQRREGGAR